MTTFATTIFALFAFNVLLIAKGENVCLIPTDKTSDATWEKKHEDLVKLTEENDSNKIVWIGASTMERMKASTLWTTKIEPLGAINFGISGDRVENILWRMESEEFKFKINIDILVIYTGSNNVYDDSPEDIAEGIINLVDIAKEKLGNELIVIIPTLLPRGEDPNDVARSRLTKINDLVNQAYPENPTNNVYFIKIDQNAVGSDGMLSTDDFVDYLHPSDSGYTKFFTPVYDLIVKILSHH